MPCTDEELWQDVYRQPKRAFRLKQVVLTALQCSDVWRRVDVDTERRMPR